MRTPPDWDDGAAVRALGSSDPPGGFRVPGAANVDRGSLEALVSTTMAPLIESSQNIRLL